VVIVIAMTERTDQKATAEGSRKISQNRAPSSTKTLAILTNSLLLQTWPTTKILLPLSLTMVLECAKVSEIPFCAFRIERTSQDTTQQRVSRESTTISLLFNVALGPATVFLHPLFRKILFPVL